INGVYPGRYWIRLGRPPAGMHLAGLMLDERDALDQPVDLGPKSPPIRVIYRAGGGFLRGSVENGARVTVALLPRGPGSERGVYIETQCDSSGRFEFDALRPGDYYAVAFREVNGNPLEDPVFLADIGAHAAAVPVQAGTVASLELRIARWPD
ncbi:MAG: hypothetical protein LAQ30_06550, partial [Acidobacteriia bacterium]|nr:hypothetical protein [Terriglobia bacterium]